MGQDLERHLPIEMCIMKGFVNDSAHARGHVDNVGDVPFVGVVSFLLHHFEDAPAGVGAVLGRSIDGDGLL